MERIGGEDFACDLSTPLLAGSRCCLQSSCPYTTRAIARKAVVLCGLQIRLHFARRKAKCSPSGQQRRPASPLGRIAASPIDSLENPLVPYDIAGAHRVKRSPPLRCLSRHSQAGTHLCPCTPAPALRRASRPPRTSRSSSRTPTPSPLSTISADRSAPPTEHREDWALVPSIPIDLLAHHRATPDEGPESFRRELASGPCPIITSLGALWSVEPVEPHALPVAELQRIALDHGLGGGREGGREEGRSGAGDPAPPNAERTRPPLMVERLPTMGKGTRRFERR